jgi:hypothetical protein
MSLSDYAAMTGEQQREVVAGLREDFDREVLDALLAAQISSLPPERAAQVGRARALASALIDILDADGRSQVDFLCNLALEATPGLDLGMAEARGGKPGEGRDEAMVGDLIAEGEGLVVYMLDVLGGDAPALRKLEALRTAASIATIFGPADPGQVGYATAAGRRLAERAMRELPPVDGPECN